MGKPYEQELQKLDETSRWIDQAHLDDLLTFFECASQHPLISVGSGGSLTAAAFATKLHEDLGRLAVSLTPLEFVRSPRFANESSVLILTAGGRNPDVLHSFRYAAESEASQVLAICTRIGSPIRHLSQSYQYTSVCEYELPSGKDGFLATNSLIATIGLLMRSNRQLFGSSEPELRLPLLDWLSATSDLEPQFEETSTLLVLHGGWSTPAALDLESKMHEAGICSVQLADYRNFAHGRHFWLAKHPNTCVVAISTGDEAEIAESTLRVLPKQIFSTSISTEERGPIAGVELIVRVFDFVGKMARTRNQDPGKPRVPPYGRKIYHLETLKDYAAAASNMSVKDVAIRRKLQQFGVTPEQMRLDRKASDAYDQFIERLHTTTFGGVVCDYDGTLCWPKDRHVTGVSTAVSNELNRLLAGGALIGIATGRGGSVRESLQQSITKDYRPRVLIGYHNGGEIGFLNEDRVPPSDNLACSTLQEVLNNLQSSPVISSKAKLTLRIPQITIIPNNRRDWALVRAAALEIVARLITPIKIVESSHSIDILAHGVSKLLLVEKCRQICKNQNVATDILCIGDRGMWTGNDCELLSLNHSLSVDAVSSDLDSCWNAAPAGIRGVQATIHYLQSLKFVKGSLRLQLPHSKGSTRCATR